MKEENDLKCVRCGIELGMTKNGKFRAAKMVDGELYCKKCHAESGLNSQTKSSKDNETGLDELDENNGMWHNIIGIYEGEPPEN